MVFKRLFGKPEKHGRLPNLLCVGVEKCGTTFLNAAFAPCPDVLTPTKKELFFFNDYFERGPDWYRSWYDFDAKPGARYVADITPSYFRSRRNLERIQQLLPGVKLIMVLRHPVYRSFSHYVHRIRHVATKLDAYSCSYADILARKDAYALLCPSYKRHLQWLANYFPRDDILLLTYEQDILQPQNAETKLGTFLGLESLDFSPMLGRRVNEGLMPRFYYGGDVGQTDAGGRRPEPGTLLLAHARGTQVWENIDPEVAAANIDAANRWTASLSGEQIASIYSEHFAGEADYLQSEFGLDVSQWEAMNDAVHYRNAVPDPNLLAAR